VSRLRVSILFVSGMVLSTLLPFTAGRADAASAGSIPDHPALNDNFTFVIGLYAPRSAVNALVTPSGGGTGVGVDFENTLGLSERSYTPLTAFIWRVSDRWRLEAEYFRLNRNASRTLSEDIEWNGVTYTAGTAVDSKFDFFDARVSGGYSFYKTQDKELGVGLGVHMTGLKAGITASGTALSDDGDVLAPLPVLSLYGNFGLTNEWALRLRTDWFALSYGDYSGELVSAALDVLYQPWRHVGFGFGMNSYMLDVEIKNTDWKGRARVAFNGPTVFVYGTF
jgi:hypothetical protein